MRNHKSQTRVNRQAHYDGLGARIDAFCDGDLRWEMTPARAAQLDKLCREQSAHVQARMRVPLAVMERQTRSVRRWDKRHDRNLRKLGV